MSRLGLHLLGAPRITLGGEVVELDTRKAVALLAYMAVTGQRHTRDTLVALLWPEYDQQRGRAALRRTLSTLKTAVSGQGLAIERESLGLDWSSDLLVDVIQFRELLEQRKDHGHASDESCPACLAPLTEAVELYSGDFMSGFSLRDSPPFDDWSYLQGETLRRELSGALQGVMGCLQMERRYSEAVNYGAQLLDLDPLHEPAHRKLMKLLVLDGQRTAALQQYRECVRILDAELSVPPLAETTSLYEKILSGRFPEVEDAGTAAIQSALQGKTASYQTSGQTQPQPLLPELPLAGRSKEMQALIEWHRNAGPEGRVIIIEGEAGIGKTRLASAFLDYVRGAGGLTSIAQCYQGEAGLAYAPFVEALTVAVRRSDDSWRERLSETIMVEVGRLMPELIPPSLQAVEHTPMESAGAQQRFFDAIAQILVAVCASASPGVIFLDDVQWADDASLDLLNYLVHRIRSWPLFILLSWRSEEVLAGGILENMLAHAQREGSGRRIHLDRLDAAAVKQLVSAAAERPEEAKKLFVESEGLPYFLVEYLSLSRGQGLRSKGSDIDMASISSPEGESIPMPEGVRDLLRSRLLNSGEIAQQMLQTGAVIGRLFSLDLLIEASGRSEEEIVTALDSLLAQGLLIERSSQDDAGETGRSFAAPIYDFNHEKMRTYVYEEMSMARRRLLHKRVAATLVEGGERQSFRNPYSAAQAAHHYQLAGMEVQAAEQFKQAGERARALFANVEALGHYEAALALGLEQPVVLHEAIGDLLTLRGFYERALQNYEGAAALISPGSDPGELSRLEMKLGRVYHRRGQWDLAAGHYEQAVERMSGEGEKAQLLTDWSLTEHHRGQGQRALVLAEQAVDIANSTNNKKALAQAYNVMGVLANAQGDWKTANQRLEESLSLAQKINEPDMIVAALNNLSIARRYAGETDQAINLVERALSLCQEVGDRHREAALHNNLADLYHLSGRTDASMDQLKEAVAIYAEIGGEPGEWRPEIWKLTEW